MEPDDVLRRGTGDRPERRGLRLRLEQLGLGHERKRGEVVERVHCALPEPLRVERRSGPDSGDLGRQEPFLEPPLAVEREALDVGAYVRVGRHRPIVMQRWPSSEMSRSSRPTTSR